MVEADVVVVGSGPAGASVAMMLAPRRRVLMIERGGPPRARIGESLISASRRLLEDMGLWPSFVSQGHGQCFSRRSVWGSSELKYSDSISDLDGAGWLLDRSRFDQWLLDHAKSRGAALLSGINLCEVVPEKTGFRMAVLRRGRRLVVRTRALVDAGGRASAVSLKLGARRVRNDRLVCLWLRGQDHHPGSETEGFSYVETDPDGWWYTAPVPGGERILAFHTDADLPAARAFRGTNSFLAGALCRPTLGALLRESGFGPLWRSRTSLVSANGSELDSAGGLGWIAVGDAGQAFDPLSSQGLFHALYTGFIGASAIDRHLDGDSQAIPEYSQQLMAIRQAYSSHIKLWYDLERRWADRPFWRRRVKC